MGYKNRTEQESGFSHNTSSLSEALLFATMCIIGLPVDVHVKDGSIYSGVFYTASVENGYGIVLKNAKMTKKGKCNANVAIGVVVETLVILSDDLVQVVAKGVMLPADGVAGDDVEAAAGTVSCSGVQTNEAKEFIRSGVNNKRRTQKRNSARNENGYANSIVSGIPKEHEVKKQNQTRHITEVENGNRDMSDVSQVGEDIGYSHNARQVGDDRVQEVQVACVQDFELQREETVEEVRGSSSSSPVSQTHVKPVEEEGLNMISKQLNNVPHHSTEAKLDIQCSERSASTDASLSSACSRILTPSSSAAAVNYGLVRSSVASIEVVPPPQSLESNKMSKEFKLNPEARIFSPSYTNPLSATSPSVQPNMGYLPSNPTVIPVAADQPEVVMSPYVTNSSSPTKFVPYGNLTAGNGGTAVQFQQPVGHMGGRMPVRYANHYPVQAPPAYVHPNPQAVVVGRIGGQVVYMQPVPNDLAQSVQGVASITPASARPPLTPLQVPFPKHQGSLPGQPMQLCMPLPLITNGMQPYSLPPGHIPVLQPSIPTTCPIPMPGSNGLYPAKFP